MSALESVTTIPVAGIPSYNVLVGHGVATTAAELLEGAATVAVVADERLADLAEPVAASIEAVGIRVARLTIPAGEDAKQLAVAAVLWDELAEVGITRTDALVSVGGGATTDVVGFAASTWLRGVRVVHVPTTLLAMVDAAVGGKTGINTNAGKNLVGAFHPPAGVLVDLDVLATLPRPEWVNGMAEVVKAGFIADPRILELIESDTDAAGRPDGVQARDLIEHAIVMKAAVVSADLREAGLREMLNYGHTLGHAIERVEAYGLPHGHAVSIGMVFAAALSRLAGRLDPVTAERHRRVLDAVGLPTSYRGASLADLMTVMRIDKKARGDRLRFVVLDGLARPGILEAPDDELLDQAFAEVSR